MCDACYEHDAGGAPACARCVCEIGTRQQRAITLAISIAGIGAGFAFWAGRKGHLTPLLASLAAAAAVLVAIGTALLVRSGANREFERRDREKAPAPPQEQPAPAHPYRQRARQIAMRLSPTVSGSTTTLALCASFILAAILFPFALKLPPWVELEIVLGTWWLLVAGVSVTLLYRGYRIKDDYVFVSPFRSKAKEKKNEKDGKTSSGWGWGDFVPSGCDAGCGALDEAIVFVILAVIALVLFAGAAWVLVELALPIVVFAAYTLLLRALQRVARDRHAREGNLQRSLGWGTFWATIYITPLAVIVALIR